MSRLSTNSINCIPFQGGVTCSSLDVLAGLSLDDKEFFDLMTFKDGKPTAFYNSYVKDIQQKIIENAAAEFQCIQKEHSRLKGAKPRSIISDELSSIINDLQDELENSDLFDDVPSRRGVMTRAIPVTLRDKVGLDELLNRLPEQYQRALFSSWVASHYVCAAAILLPSLMAFASLSQVYRYGVAASSVDFFHFARDLAA